MTVGNLLFCWCPLIIKWTLICIHSLRCLSPAPWERRVEWRLRSQAQEPVPWFPPRRWWTSSPSCYRVCLSCTCTHVLFHCLNIWWRKELSGFWVWVTRGVREICIIEWCPICHLTHLAVLLCTLRVSHLIACHRQPYNHTPAAEFKFVLP